MGTQANRNLSLLLPLLLLLALAVQQIQFTDARKRRVRIPDELDDVINDEGDDEWRDWGEKSSPSSEFDIPPADLDTMELSQIQEEMTSRHKGPVYGFVKLGLGVERTQESVSAIAKKWTKMLKAGGIELSFLGIDLSTVMFTLQRGQDKEELKDFILDQPDAYEVKFGDQAYRRTGDPPLDQLIEMLRSEKDESGNPTRKDHNQNKEEL